MESIWTANLPSVEKKRLLTRIAMAAAFHCAPGYADPDNSENNNELFEVDFLAEILVTFGKKTTITEAKQQLRQQGQEGYRLASRLSKLNKLRNGRCHPDIGLLGDIQELIGRQHPSQATEPTNNDYSTSAEQQTKAEVCADEVTLKEQKFVDIKHNSAIVNGDSDTDLGAPAVTDMQNIGGTKPQPHQASIGARCSSSDDGALMSASTQHMCRAAIPTADGTHAQVPQ